ncbi:MULTISPECIES: hypothetical protein [Bacteria]|nr:MULTISPECIES: hypothetical protein [Bacteria]
MHDQEHDQELAATVAALLLVGVTLIAREAVGLWPAAALGMGLVLAVSWGPAAARRIVLAVELRRLRRHFAAWERGSR